MNPYGVCRWMATSASGTCWCSRRLPANPLMGLAVAPTTLPSSSTRTRSPGVIVAAEMPTGLTQ